MSVRTCPARRLLLTFGPVNLSPVMRVSQIRQKVLLSALSRAVKDPFPPARQAGVLAMAATHNLFTLRESAFRLLPLLSTLSMDPEKAVRDQVRTTHNMHPEKTRPGEDHT